jgi:CRP-like cAMP-binding protein
MAATVHSMTATASTPSTVMRIPRSLFLKTLDGYPDAARRIRDHVLARAKETERDLTRLHAHMSSSSRGP